MLECKSLESFFPKHSDRRKKLMYLSNAQWQTLKQDTMIEGIKFSVGSRYKVFETKNFGWIVFDSKSVTPDGNIPGRRIFKF